MGGYCGGTVAYESRQPDTEQDGDRTCVHRTNQAADITLHTSLVTLSLITRAEFALTLPAIYNPARLYSVQALSSVAIHEIDVGGDRRVPMRDYNTDMTPRPPIHQVPGWGTPPSAWSLLRVSGTILACALFTACPPDNTPLIEENERLKKQNVKQETMMATIQDGNRILQEQIDRLNQELRDNEQVFAERIDRAQQTGQSLSTENHNLLKQIQTLTKDNQKLKQVYEKLKAENTKHKGDAQWLRKQREIFRQSLQANTQTAKTQRFPYPLRDVIKATSQALAQHGYMVLAKMATDTKAVFVTERKTAPSSSIESRGYRNQYLVELTAQSTNQTALKIRSQYEKMRQAEPILDTDSEEVSDLEQQFIQAIHQRLDQPRSKAKSKATNK